MKSIILEGPNGAGKSTLGMKLTLALGMPYRHPGPSPDRVTSTLSSCCMEQLSWLLDGSVVDRVTPISEPVYNQNLTHMELGMMKGILYNMLENAIVVYCTSDGDFTKKPYYPDGHFEEIVRDKADIRHRYMEAMSEIPHIHYDWTKDSDELIIERIKTWKN